MPDQALVAKEHLESLEEKNLIFVISSLKWQLDNQTKRYLLFASTNCHMSSKFEWVFLVRE